MHNPYLTRAGGATVTVFVPYDCQNHCPFCINKQEYADTSAFSLEKIISSIREIDTITPCCDFVFTGGEPFANIESLQLMLDAVSPTHNVYINTTFPVQAHTSLDEMLAFTQKNKEKISCINISRHVRKYVEECNDDILGKIACKTRVNCVLYKNYPVNELIPFAERFLPYRIPIQFRYDYTETTLENLYKEDDDQILTDLKKCFVYKGLNGCRIRNGYHFEYKGLHMTYHKTLPYSTLQVDVDSKTYDVLYDILIKQTGEFHSDWTGIPLDLEAYRNVTYEPYDLKVLDGTIDF